MRRFYTILFAFAFAFLGTKKTYAHVSNPTSGVPKILFEENKTQWPEQVKFQSDLPNGKIFLEKNLFTYLFRENVDFHHHSRIEPITVKYHAFKVRFLNSNPDVAISGNNPFAFHRNYYLGNDPRKWSENVNVFADVSYTGLYTNIDMNVYTKEGALKYDFIVNPGANPNWIKLKYEAADNLSIKDGNLIIETSVGKIIEQKPFAYQLIGGSQREVACAYSLNEDNVLGFHLAGGYDPNEPLIIDPTLIVSTYTGSTADNWGFTATYDAAGNIYTGGIAESNGYPTTAGAFQTTFQGGTGANPFDVVVTKFNSTGTAIVYSSYVGGSDDEQPHSMVVNSSNELFVMGRTYSINFPTSVGAYDMTPNGGSDLFIFKFNTTGGRTAATVVGGSADDGVNYNAGFFTYGNLKYNYADDGRGEIILDNSGNVYVAGCTQSSDFPTASAYDASLGGVQDACVFKIGPTLGAGTLAWSTYLGGSSDDVANGIKVDGSNVAYVAGGTMSADFPTTGGAFRTAYQGGTADGFITKIGSAGNTLVNSSFIGTASYDQCYFVELDLGNNVYVMGCTEGAYTVSAGVYSNAGSKQFIQKLPNSLATSTFSTIFGNASTYPSISPTAFLVDSCENLYVSGWGRAASFSTPTSGTTTGMPITANAYQSTTDGADFYFIVLTANAQSLWYGTFFGQNGGEADHVDGGTSRFDRRAVIYQSVCASCGFGSDAFPTTAGAWSNFNNSSNCNNAVIKMDVKVKAVAVASAIPPSLTGCAPFLINFSSTGSTATGYQWNFGDGSPVDVTANPSHTYTASGSYTVTFTAVVSMGSCSVTDVKTLVVTVGSSSAITPTPTNVSCFGGTNGSATVNPTGGLTPYTYAWSPTGQTTSTATGLSAGTTYTVIVSDNVGCSSTGTVTLTQPTALNTTSVTSTPKACSSNNGTATIFPTGGTPAYTYAWNPTGQTTSTATGLNTGNYTVTVTDNNGCVSTRTVNVSVAASPTVTATSTPGGCTVPNGTATASASLGTPAYTYAWSPGGQTTSAVTGLTAGVTYTILLTDANGCTRSNTVTVGTTGQPTVTATSTLAGCSVANGTATANASSGTPGYTYAWSPGGQTTSTATGLSGGNYTITITDANGCTRSNTVTVGATGQPTVTTTSTLAGCSVANGTATANASLGTPAYTYAWSPGGQTTSTATGLSGGNYTVTITDSNGCTRTGTVSVGSTTVPTVTASATQPTGCTVNVGTATASPSGGTPGYSYAWSPGGQTSQTATGLTAGTHTLILTDSNGCQDTTTVSITVSLPPSVTAAATSQTGCAVSIGTATATPTGGTPGYTYNWIPGGQTTQTATGLSAGTYSVILTDANGCADTATAMVTTANGPTTTSSAANNVSCNGGANGSATTNPSGGTPAYTYVWSPGGQTSQTATGLTAGSYTVVVSDVNGCSFTDIVSITEPALLATTPSQTNVNCFGGGNGSATVTTSGGTPGYTYSWSNGQSTSTATGLSGGTYTATITDANGCMNVNVFTITEPTLLSSTPSQTNILCNGGSNGSASASVSGGTPGYTYSWSSGQSTSAISGINAGNYTVTITDANGCTSTNTFSITEPPAIAITNSQVNILCNGGNNGSAAVSVSGGTPNYTYAWSNGQSTSTATGLISGSYTATVTDANGCSSTTTFTISQPAVLASAVSSTTVTCNGGNNGSATATPSGGTANYSYAWSNGQSSATTTGLSAGNYTVIITDANNCTTTNTVSITEPPPITLAVSGGDSICLGDSTVLTATALGGTPAYTYIWTPGPQNGTPVTVYPTSSTSYSVSMTDANGCVSLTQTFNVVVLPGPTALFDTSSNGMFSSVYSFTDQGTGGLSWYWNFGDGSAGSTLQNPIHTFPGAGTYQVMQIAYNSSGCPDTFMLTVIIPENILIPNVFTPDANGTNDVWYIPNSGMKEFHVEIFDRWGLKVFETTADEIRWDGRSMSGIKLSNGTYYFVLDAVLQTKDNGERIIKYKGYITLLTRSK